MTFFTWMAVKGRCCLYNDRYILYLFNEYIHHQSILLTIPPPPLHNAFDFPTTTQNYSLKSKGPLKAQGRLNTSPFRKIKH